jgi:hypothetical protein
MRSQYVYNSQEYTSFAKFCEVIESFHGKITHFDGLRVAVEWKSMLNRLHFEHFLGY